MGSRAHAQNVDPPELSEGIGAQGTEICVLAVGRHQDPVQGGRTARLYHHRGVAELRCVEPELYKVPRQQQFRFPSR